jgi:hypothetical protein
MRALTTHLNWKPREAVDAKEAVLDINEHPGLQAILDSVEQRKLDITSQLLTRPPRDQGAEYADLIGTLKGLEELPLLIAGIVEYGRKAEHALREEVES